MMVLSIIVILILMNFIGLMGKDGWIEIFKVKAYVTVLDRDELVDF